MAVKSQQRWAAKSAECDLVREADCLGGSLDHLIKAHGPLTEQHYRQCLAGLSHMHGRCIPQRPLKTANVLLQSEGGVEGNTVKLAYFPQPFEGGPDVLSTQLCCTPEVFRGRYCAKCDMWSAGVMLYIMRPGSSPFPCDAARRLPLPSYELGGTWSGSFHQFVRQLMAVNVDLRLTAEQSLDASWFHELAEDQVESHEAVASVENSDSKAEEVSDPVADTQEQPLLFWAAWLILALRCWQDAVTTAGAWFVALGPGCSNSGAAVDLDLLHPELDHCGQPRRRWKRHNSLFERMWAMLS